MTTKPTIPETERRARGQTRLSVRLDQDAREQVFRAVADVLMRTP